MSSLDFLFVHLGAFFCGLLIGAKRLLLPIGWLLGGATWWGGKFSREDCRASATSVEGVKYTRKLQVTLLKK
jgi:hypothetical protein